MFEFEIMLTGYTLLVATASVAVSKLIYRKQYKIIHKKLTALEIESQKLNLDIKMLHNLLKDRATKVNTL